MKTLDYRFKILGMVKYNEFGEATKLNFKIEVDPSKGILDGLGKSNRSTKGPYD